MERTYTVVLLREGDGGYYVLVPALPGCVTQGDTVEQCKERVKEAILCFTEGLAQVGESVPGDVETVEFEMGDAQEALVYRMTVRQEREAAQAAYASGG